jgi:hypothetical protein
MQRAHRGTVLRMVARDPVVAQRIAADIARATSARSSPASTSTALNSTASCASAASHAPRPRRSRRRRPRGPRPLAGGRACGRACALPVTAFKGVQVGRPRAQARCLRRSAVFACGCESQHTAPFRRAVARLTLRNSHDDQEESEPPADSCPLCRRLRSSALGRPTRSQVVHTGSEWGVRRNAPLSWGSSFGPPPSRPPNPYRAGSCAGDEDRAPEVRAVPLRALPLRVRDVEVLSDAVL